MTLTVYGLGLPLGARAGVPEVVRPLEMIGLLAGHGMHGLHALHVLHVLHGLHVLHVLQVSLPVSLVQRLVSVF